MRITFDWSTLLLGALYAALGTGGCLTQTGCSAAYWTGRLDPHTSIKVNPMDKTIEFFDDKNNDVTLKGLRSTGADGKLTSLDIDELTIRNNATDVIAADAARMEQILKLQQVQVEYVAQLGANFTSALHELSGLATQIAVIARALPALAPNAPNAPDDAGTQKGGSTPPAAPGGG